MKDEPSLTDYENQEYYLFKDWKEAFITIVTWTLYLLFLILVVGIGGYLIWKLIRFLL
jgi:hypothetical protein